jgi:hypothetical protein
LLSSEPYCHTSSNKLIFIGAELLAFSGAKISVLQMLLPLIAIFLF